MISKVERAEASPTAALLGRLSGALHLTVSALLARAEADAGPSRVARADAQPLWTDPATGYRRRALSPPGAEPELVEVTLPPGARVAYTAASFAFLRGQVAWVIAGRLVIEEGTEEARLTEGDCLAFDLDTPRGHAFRNPSRSRPCRYIVALSRR
jgi:transcriptional regulator with XRE-family HTH domain